MGLDDSAATARSPARRDDETRAATPRARDGAPNCLDANQIAELLEGVMPDEQRRYAEEHIDTCNPCRELVGGLATRLSLMEGSTAATLVGVSRYARGWVSTMRSEHSTTNASLAPGAPLDHYEIKRLLGRGGMGEVYLARDNKLERDVAIKMVRFFHDDSNLAVQRFMTEARMTARLNHPHIVTVHAVGEHEGRPYLALEYVRGDTMRKWMRAHGTRGMDVEALGIALAIAEALEEAHAHGILHRDLKPENVLIDQRGRVRVVDFGLALHFAPGADADENSKSSNAVFTGIAGTPRYMAPEQWIDGEQGAAVDAWAFGVILFELITGGLHPSGKTSASEASLLRFVAVASGEVDGLPDDFDVAPALRALVARCLEKDPSLRPTASEIVLELRDLLDEAVPRSRVPARIGWTAVVLAVLAGGGAVFFALGGFSKAEQEQEQEQETQATTPAVSEAPSTTLPETTAPSPPPTPAPTTEPMTAASAEAVPPASATPGVKVKVQPKKDGKDLLDNW